MLFLRVFLTIIAHVIVPDMAIALGHVIGLVILRVFISVFVVGSNLTVFAVLVLSLLM